MYLSEIYPDLFLGSTNSILVYWPALATSCLPAPFRRFICIICLSRIPDLHTLLISFSKISRAPSSRPSQQAASNILSLPSALPLTSPHFSPTFPEEMADPPQIAFLLHSHPFNCLHARLIILMRGPCYAPESKSTFRWGLKQYFNKTPMAYVARNVL